MKKQLLLLPFATLLLMTTGCKSSAVDYSDPKKLRIRFHVDKKSTEGQAYQKMIDEFNRENGEGIKVTATFVARSAGDTSYDTSLAKDKRQNTLPDIITFDAPKCATYASYGYFYDITNVFTAAEKAKYITLNTYKDRLYGIPIQESSAGFFVNKKLLSDAGVNIDGITVDNPWTYDQFKSVCAALKSHNIKAVDMRVYDTTSEMATYLLYPFIYASGGSFVDESGKRALGYFNSEGSIRGFQFIKDLLSNSYTGYDIGPTDFFDGRVAMYLSSGWTIPDLDIKYKATFQDRNAWALLPYPKDVTRASANGSWCYAMGNTSRKDKSTVIKLFKYITNAKSSKAITDATGMIPANKDVDTSSYQAAEQVLLKQLADTSVKRPDTVGYKSFSDYFRMVISSLDQSDVTSNVNDKAQLLQNELDKIKVS